MSSEGGGVDRDQLIDQTLELGGKDCVDVALSIEQSSRTSALACRSKQTILEAQVVNASKISWKHCKGCAILDVQVADTSKISWMRREEDRSLQAC